MELIKTEMEPLYTLGEEKIQFIYFVTKGLISMNIPNYPCIKKYAKDNIVGLENVFHEGTHFTTAVPDGICHLQRIPLDYYKLLCEKY